MRPKRFTLTTGNQVVPLSYRNGAASVIAVPTAANYDVAYTTAPIQDGVTATWIELANMDAATANQAGSVPIGATAIRIVLNSGTNVVVDVAQSVTAG